MDVNNMETSWFAKIGTIQRRSKLST